MDQQKTPQINLSQPAYQKPQKNNLGIIIAIVATFLITGGAMFSWQQITIKKIQQENEKITNDLWSKSEELGRRIIEQYDELKQLRDEKAGYAGWNKYFSTKGYYSFRYPDGLYVQEGYDGSGNLSNDLFLRTSADINTSNLDVNFRLYGTESAQEILSDYKTGLPLLADGPLGSIEGTIKSSEDFTAPNGLKGYKFFVAMERTGKSNEKYISGPNFIFDVTSAKNTKLGNYKSLIIALDPFNKDLVNNTNAELITKIVNSLEY